MKKTEPVLPENKLMFSVPTLADLADVSPNHIHNQIKNGDLVASRMGRRKLISREEATRFLKSLPTE